MKKPGVKYNGRKLINSQKIFLIVLLAIFPFIFLIGQNRSLIKKKYECTMLLMNGDSARYTLFYMIDNSRQVKFRHKVYSLFTFSTDSTDISGYIRFDTLKREFHFLSKHYKAPKNYCTETYKAQKIFLLSGEESDQLCSVGELGSYFKTRSTPGSNGCFAVKIRYLFNLPSHSTIISQVRFCKELYPCNIEVSFPTGKQVVLSASDY